MASNLQEIIDFVIFQISNFTFLQIFEQKFNDNEESFNINDEK
jgi:hypothetical protein